MAIIPQTKLFCWEDVENLGDLERLRLVLESIPDESLMQKLEDERGRGRDDYPVRAMWNSLLAGVVFQHRSIESLRRELLRNDRLRWICGFDPVMEAEDAVPEAWNYSRFLTSLFSYSEQIDEMFDTLVEMLREELAGFGRSLAIDSKGIESHGRPRGKEKYDKLKDKERREGPDRRRDLDADWGKKTYKGKNKDGTLYKTTKKWFGYKLHLIVDSFHELPVAYELTQASASDIKCGESLFEETAARHPEMVEECEEFSADKGYDALSFITMLWDGADPENPRRILPIVPKRNDWKEKPDECRPLFPGIDNITYDCQGQIYCWCMKTGQRRKMVYDGYEEKRDTQKWRCPAAVYGIKCENYTRCSKGSDYGRVVRVKRFIDPRTFLPVARSSYKFERLYKERTAVERVNSRLDVSYGFEEHFIRTGGKMKFRCGLALIVMLSMALGRIRENRKKAADQEYRAGPSIRSLVRAA